MSQLKLSKIELKTQRTRLEQFRKYLPVLELKKILLNSVLTRLEQEILELGEVVGAKTKTLQKVAPLFAKRGMKEFLDELKIQEVKKSYENVAGIDLPVLEGVTFVEQKALIGSLPSYALSLKGQFFELLEKKVAEKILKERKDKLKEELRSVTVKVNLFEKILIPRTEENIKKIRVFLDDMQLSQIGVAKKAKELVMKKGGR